MTELPKRKHPRLKDYDYSRAGGYFITVCTYHKRCMLCEIVGRGLAPAEIHLLPPGRIVAEELEALPARFPGLVLEKTVIMPNHVHILLTLPEAGASPRPTVSDIMRVFKSLTARRMGGQKLWQTSYHDHILRDENDLLTHWLYMDQNSARWAEDEYNA